MTREEARKMLRAKLECLKNETSGINDDCNMRLCDGCPLNYEQGNMGEQKEALELAIKALEQQPTDAVSRSELQKTMDSLPSFSFVNNGHEEADDYYSCESVDMVIRNLPSVTPQPKMGHWIADVDRWGDIVTTTDGYRCSECSTFNTDKDNYCPECGAKMAESEDKE